MKNLIQVISLCEMIILHREIKMSPTTDVVRPIFECSMSVLI